MVKNIWGFFIVSGIIYGLFTGKMSVINTTIIDSCKTSLRMIMEILPVIALWMGIMKIAEDSLLLKKLSRLIYPILKIIFPEIPKGDESLSLIASNVIANIFGLGSAATPFGLKAMEALQKINKNKDTASNSMITFLVLNTSGLTIIPTTVISLRVMYNSNSPMKIVSSCIIATICSTLGGLLINYILSRRKKY